MNWILVCLMAAGWLSGLFDALDSVGSHEQFAWNSESSFSGIPHVQANAPEKKDRGASGAEQASPLGGEQSWGALIVFALGIVIFLVAYFVWGRTPRPKKKKKKKLF